MEATVLGDVRVATYIILQERMGKIPPARWPMG